MARGVIDLEGIESKELQEIKNLSGTPDLPFRINKIGHVVLMVTDLKRSVDFYTNVLGFSVSDVYPETMMPGCMVFMRFSSDHHGVALVGKAPNLSLIHISEPTRPY